MRCKVHVIQLSSDRCDIEGSIEMNLGQTFNTKVDALVCFGFTGKMLQAGVWRIRTSATRSLWFPWLGEYKFGTNSLSVDETELIDKRVSNFPPNGQYATMDEKLERVVFLGTRVERNQVLFTFKGVFKPDILNSQRSISTWKRVSDHCREPDGSWTAEEA